MRLSNDQYEFIKGEVVALFERYDVRCIPISGFELAFKMGIQMIPYSSLNHMKQTAALTISSDGFYMEDQYSNDIIFYNDSVAYDRMNMTVMHEIGHCVLDHRGETEEEAEASFFAKYAMAPPPLVNRICPRSPSDIEIVFNISHTAAEFAYTYYQKWLRYGRSSFTDYEIRLIRLFSAA